MTAVALWILAAAAAFGCALAGLRREVGSSAHVPLPALAAASTLGAAVALVLPDYMSLQQGLVLSVLGGLLLAGALIDRQLGMALDWTSGPVLGFSLAAGYVLAAPGADVMAPLFWVALGLAAFVALNFGWLALDRSTGGRALPPPADLVAILLPIIIFGPSLAATVFYIMCSIVALLCLRIPQFAAIFTREEIADAMRSEITDDEGRQAIAGLALLYPAVWLLLLRAAALA